MRRLLIISVLTCLVHVLLPAQTIRPVPHQVQTDGKKTLNLSRAVALSDPKGVFEDVVDFLNRKPKGISMTVDFGTAVAQQAGVRQESGAYMLDITSKGVTVIGFDERGAFYGLQTLRQLVEESDDRKVPCCRIYDWPDSPDRGIVDSYYGGHWSQEFRLSMIDLAARLKMNEYVYAPKNDPYVGSPDWIMPYPQGRGDNLKELMEACRRNRIEFTWCVRPDGEFTWSEDDYALLLGKFEMMHYFGVRSFGIFLDDIPYSEGIEDKKKDLIDRLNTDFIAKKKGLEPLLASLDGYYVPAEGSESLKLGMYGVADAAWNKEAFDSDKSLDWAVNEIAPDVAGAYMTYARHSEVSVNSFGMNESAGIGLIGLQGYSQESYDALMEEFRSIENAPASIANSSNQALYADIKPALEEFEKLGARCRRILECIRFYNSGDVPGFWATYAADLMSDKDIQAYMAHPSGTAVLQPFYERMMKELAEAFDQAYKGKVGYTHIPGEGIQTYIAPDEASVCHLVLDNPEGREVIVRLSDAKGQFTAEFCIVESYFEFEMKEDAVKVEVLGDVRVFETVFVK